MKATIQYRRTAFAAFFIAFVMFAHAVPTTLQTKASQLDEESARKFLRSQDHDRKTRYFVVFRDLNADGTPEAIVYLMGPEWCGTGGCTLLVLQKSLATWKIISHVTVTNPPIRMLESTCAGWRSLAVWVEGGGIHPGYEAVLCFNGKTYPQDLSRRVPNRFKGEVLIDSVKNPKFLW